MQSRITPLVLFPLAFGAGTFLIGSIASADPEPAASPSSQPERTAPSSLPGEDPEDTFAIQAVTTLNEPWAMTFLPDGRLLITEKPGHLLVVTTDGNRSAPVTGVPEVDSGGQGGLGDVVLHPAFAENRLVYLSYAEAGDGRTRGAAVARARLIEDAEGGGALEALEVIWRPAQRTPSRSSRPRVTKPWRSTISPW